MNSENLPRWDLSDLYAGPAAAELMADLTKAEAAADRFADDYDGKVGALSAPGLAQAIVRYEQDEDLLGRISSYAQLYHAADVSDRAVGRFYQTTMERLSEITSKLIFFALELNRIEDDALAGLLAADPGLARYAPWLRDIRASRPHQLADAQERLLHEKQVTGRAAWIRLFDETMSNLRFPMRNAETGEDEQKTSEEVLHLLSGKDADLRREAALSLGKVFADNVRLFALITNTLAKDKDIEDRWRAFADPADSRHLANQVEGEVVAARADAVKAAYPAMSHRYYALKARWMGKESLDYWDRNAPLPEDDDRLVTWPEAVAAFVGILRDAG
ncbi:MAG: oligoendopeptidase F, partial [Alphaproteobacteria bacterium]|nr:oligoendopeptidase F [Alphaproteobacteria bacterium]